MPTTKKLILYPDDFRRNTDGVALHVLDGGSPRYVGYIVMKAVNVITPALRTLLSDADVEKLITEGIEVTIVPKED